MTNERLETMLFHGIPRIYSYPLYCETFGTDNSVVRADAWSQYQKGYKFYSYTPVGPWARSVNEFVGFYKSWAEFIKACRKNFAGVLTF